MHSISHKTEQAKCNDPAAPWKLLQERSSWYFEVSVQQTSGKSAKWKLQGTDETADFVLSELTCSEGTEELKDWM